MMLKDGNKLKNKVYVEYAFCVSEFLQDKLESDDKKYKNMRKIMKKDNIRIFYGDTDDYKR